MNNKFSFAILCSQKIKRFWWMVSKREMWFNIMFLSWNRWTQDSNSSRIKLVWNQRDFKNLPCLVLISPTKSCASTQSTCENAHTSAASSSNNNDPFEQLVLNDHAWYKNNFHWFLNPHRLILNCIYPVSTVGRSRLAVVQLEKFTPIVATWIGILA